ncbi:hypothetical protein Tco_1239784, partial [Tanacetum coccineum]
QVNARTIKFKSDKEIIAEVTKSTNRDHESGVDTRQEVADKERWKKAVEEAKLAKQQSKLANERAARVRIMQKSQENGQSRTNTDTRTKRVQKSRKNNPKSPNTVISNQQQTQAGGRSFTPPPLPTTLVPETISTSIPDPYSDPNRYYKVMNPRSSRMPNDDEDGDDKDGNDEDGNANNEDGNGSDESSSESDDE